MEVFEEDVLINKKKDYVNLARLQEPKSGVLIIDFINSIINKKAKRSSKSYGRNYRTLIYHLNSFSKEYNCTLYTNSINEEFLDDFIYYLESKLLKKSYIKTIIQLLKASIRKAANYGYVVDPSYDSIEIDSEDIPSIYLSMNEITRIYYYPNLTNKQKKIRDLFVVGCLTALRYSDLTTLQKADFGDKFITKITKKTGVKVIIPIHDYVREVYNRYDGDISPNVTSQHFNRYIKLICKKVGLNDPVTITYTKGGEVITETKEKWELISSHTGRRSGATNLYNTGRLGLRDIMSITGHTTEKSFMRYIKTSKEDIANKLAGDMYFRK